MRKIVAFLAVYLFFLSQHKDVQAQPIRQYIFGHSLIDHRPPAIATPSDETTVPHWLYLLAQADGRSYAASGQYGFLPQHRQLPPFSQWGYDSVPPVWESDSEPFSAADFTHILITAGNFMQWQGPDQEYPGNPGITPISATEDIVDWLDNQEDNLRIYIYENWPDMAPYLGSGFPPTAQEFEHYQNYTRGDFHNWWLTYHDALLASRPEAEVRMIPVGPILADLLADTLLTDIPFTDLYEDDAPHGRPTLYFLAGLITYMSINDGEAPNGYTPPSIIHSDVIQEYDRIVTYIGGQLADFVDHSGNSRVYFEDMVTFTHDLVIEEDDDMLLYPNPTEGLFRILGPTSNYNIQILDAQGQLYQQLEASEEIEIDLQSLPEGLYFISIRKVSNNQLWLEKILKQ